MTHAARGVRVRQADYDDEVALRAAFEGATQVLLVSSNAAAFGGDPVAQHRRALAAAQAAGVRRVVYTSHMGADPASAFPPCVDHAKTEALLRASGLAYTALRNGFYASTVPHWLLGDAATTGRLAVPADGPVAWTAHADLAAGIAAILADEGCFDGPTPPLTGPEALDLAAVAAIVADLAGRPVARVVVPDEAFRAGMQAAGVPDARVAIALGMHQASRAGAFATVDPTLARLIGRPPIALRAVLAAG